MNLICIIYKIRNLPLRASHKCQLVTAVQENNAVHSEKYTRPINTLFEENTGFSNINPLNPELNPICYLLALLAQHFLHVSRIRVKSLTLRLLMSYIYGAPILDVSRSHTTTQHSR